VPPATNLPAMLKGRLGLDSARVPHAHRHGIMWLGRGNLYVESGTLRFLTAGYGDLGPGDCAIPFQMVSCLMLQPGTTVSHDALRILARHGTAVVCVGEDGVRFYAVKVEAIRTTGDSDLEPRFRKVVYPGGWDKDATLPRQQPESPEVRRYRQFFEPLIAEVARTGLLQPKSYMRFSNAGRYFRSLQNEGLSYAVALDETNGAWVTLHIEAGDKGLTKRLFDTLNAERSQIDSTVSIDVESEWDWRRYDRWSFSSINVRRDGSISDPPEVHDEIRRWMIDLLKKFQETFDPRVAAILSEEA